MINNYICDHFWEIQLVIEIVNYHVYMEISNNVNGKSISACYTKIELHIDFSRIVKYSST